MTWIADRHKHAGTIAATAVLPRPFRVPAREWLLSRLHRAKVRRADNIVVVHPKCGGTWFRVMLFRLYQLRYGFDSRRVLKTDELKRIDPGLPSFLVSNGRYSYEGVLGRYFDDPDSVEERRNKKLLFLSRHPCDVVVSWHIQFASRTSGYKRELINHWLRAPVEPGEISLWDFALHPEMGVPGIVDYYNSWAPHLSQPEASLLVRYEDLRTDPHVALRRVAEFLDLPSDTASIGDAVDFASFDNLRELEKIGYFENDALKPRSRWRGGEPKVGRGKIAGYCDHFRDDQVEQLEALVREKLARLYRYGSLDAEFARGAGEA